MNLEETLEKISIDYLSLTEDEILNLKELSSSEFVKVNKAIATAMRKQSGIIQSSQEYIVIFPKDSKSNNNKNRFYQDALAHHAQSINTQLFNSLSSDFSNEQIILAISKQKEKISPTDSLPKALDSLKDSFSPVALLDDLQATDELLTNFTSLLKDRKSLRDTLVLSLTNTIRQLSNKIKKDEEKKEAAYKSLSDYLIRYINEIGFAPDGKSFDTSKASFLTKVTKDLMLQFIKPTSVEEDLFYANKCLTQLNKDVSGEQAPITDETIEYINNFTLASNGDQKFINPKGNLKSDFLKFVMLKFAGFLKRNPDQKDHINQHLNVFNKVLKQAKSEAEAKLSSISSVTKTISLTNDEGVNVIENQPSTDKPYDEQADTSDHTKYIGFILKQTGKFTDTMIKSFLSSYDSTIDNITTVPENDLNMFDRHIDSNNNTFYTLTGKASISLTKNIYTTQVRIAKNIHKKISKIGIEKLNNIAIDNLDLSMEIDIYNLYIESTKLKVNNLMITNGMNISELYKNNHLSKNEIMICFPEEYASISSKSKAKQTTKRMPI